MLYLIELFLKTQIKQNIFSNYHYNNSLSKTTLFSMIDNSAACPIATALRPSSKETSASEFF